MLFSEGNKHGQQTMTVSPEMCRRTATLKCLIRSRAGKWIATFGMCLGMLGLLGSTTVRGEEPSVRSLGAITWKDITGRTYSKEEVTAAKATVFFFSSTQCPISNGYIGRMRTLANDYSAKGVRFFLVNSNNADSLATVKQY